MKISEASKYIDTLQFACDVLFADSINNAVDMTYGLSDAYDRLCTLNIGILLEESMQPKAGEMWSKLMDINHRKNEQPYKIPFTKLTPQRLKERLLVIYEQFPLIEHIDNKHLGYSSIWDDFELGKLLLQSNIENLSNIPFTRCNDVVDMLIDRLIEFQNLYSDIEQQKPSTDADESLLPIELVTPQAMIIWDKAKKAGWINEDYSFNGTKYQMAYAAEIMGQALGLKHKWKPFITLWKHKHFAQTRHESKERFGYVERGKEIESVFSL